MARISYTTIRYFNTLDTEEFIHWYLTGELFTEETKAMSEGKKAHKDIATYIKAKRAVPKPYELALKDPTVEEKREVKWKDHEIVWIPDVVTNDSIIDFKTGTTPLVSYVEQLRFYFFAELLNDHFVDKGYLIRIGEIYEPEWVMVTNSEEKIVETAKYVDEIGKEIDKLC